MGSCDRKELLKHSLQNTVKMYQLINSEIDMSTGCRLIMHKIKTAPLLAPGFTSSVIWGDDPPWPQDNTSPVVWRMMR